MPKTYSTKITQQDHDTAVKEYHEMGGRITSCCLAVQAAKRIGLNIDSSDYTILWNGDKRKFKINKAGQKVTLCDSRKWATMIGKPIAFTQI